MRWHRRDHNAGSRCASTVYDWRRRSPVRSQPRVHRLVATSWESLDASCLPSCVLSLANSLMYAISRITLMSGPAHPICVELPKHHFDGESSLVSRDLLCRSRLRTRRMFSPWGSVGISGVRNTLSWIAAPPGGTDVCTCARSSLYMLPLLRLLHHVCRLVRSVMAVAMMAQVTI